METMRRRTIRAALWLVVAALSGCAGRATVTLSASSSAPDDQMTISYVISGASSDQVHLQGSSWVKITRVDFGETVSLRATALNGSPMVAIQASTGQECADTSAPTQWAACIVRVAEAYPMSLARSGEACPMP
jgi:hypothetical protein